MSHSMVPYIIKLCLAFSAISTIMFASAGVPDGAIPFIYHNHLYIKAILQDTLPVTLIYDTGASNIYIDKDFKRLSRFMENKNDKAIALLSGAGNSDRISCPVIADPLKITIGNIKYTDVYSPVDNIRESLGRHMDLMVGNEAFKNKTLLINYKDGYILPVKKLNSKTLEGFTQLPAIFKDNRIYIEAELKVDSIQSIKGHFLLDLGCGSALVLTNKVRERLDLSNTPTARCYHSSYGIGGDASTMIFRAKSFNLLDELQDVVVNASYNKKGALAGDDGYLGIIGNPILCHYDLIIDFKHGKVYAKKNDNTDDYCHVASREQMSYIDRTDICDGWIVSSLYDDGIAQKAGFEIDDIILSINGRPVKEISWEEQRKGLGLTGRTAYEVRKKTGEIVTYILDIDKEII